MRFIPVVRRDARAASHHLRLTAGALAAALGLVACSQDNDVTGLRPQAKPSLSASPQAKHVRDSEEPFARLAEALPSSAGFYYDEAGKLVVWVSDSTDSKRAAGVLRGLVAMHRVALSAHAPNAEIVVRVGKYSFAQLSAWRDSISDFASNTQGTGVESLDLDEAKNRVTVGVLSSAATEPLSARFAQMGVDPKAVNFKVTERLKLDAGVPSTLAPATPFLAASRAKGMFLTPKFITDQQTKVLGGLEIGVRDHGGGKSYCTIGFVVRHIQSGVTKDGFTTASHCTETIFGADHDTVTQNFSSFNEIGWESHDPDDYNCGVIYDCRPSDLAFFEGKSGVSLGLGLVAKRAGSPYNDFVYDDDSPWVVTAAGSQGVYVGTYNDWVGRTTGFHVDTRVAQTCVDHFLDFLGHKLTCAMADTIPLSDGGDSGGPVFIKLGRGSEIQAIGSVTAHVTGYMIWSQVGRAISDFSGEGASLIFNPTTVTAPTISGSINGSGYPVVSWSPVSGAIQYDIYHQYAEASCAISNAGSEYAFSTSSTSFSEGIPVLGTGTFNCPWVAYWVGAVTATGYSSQSNSVSFYY